MSMIKKVGDLVRMAQTFGIDINYRWQTFEFGNEVGPTNSTIMTGSVAIRYLSRTPQYHTFHRPQSVLLDTRGQDTLVLDDPRS